MVFRADWDVTMVGLDLTHQALATPELQDRVRAVGGPISQVHPRYLGVHSDDAWRPPADRVSCRP